ncbi:octopamine receptor beta-2R-like [Oculina patagonica]
METWFWILGWFLSILTITGNGFIIFLVCSKRQLRTKTNAFIVSLAVADFCVGMSVVPSMFFCEKATGCNPQSSWITTVRLLFGYASVTNLCSLVLDRYIAVVKPLKYLTFMKRRRVIQMVSLSWGIPVLLRMVSALAWYIFKTSLKLLSWMSLTVFEFLPCLILIFFFASMLHVVYKHGRAARITAQQLRFNHRVLFKPQENSAIKIMGIVIGLFLLCYGFYIRCTFVYFFNDRKPCNDEQYKIPLLVLNSAINPVAYAFYKRDIKKEINRCICCVDVKQRNKVHPVLDNCFTLQS